MNLLVDLYEPAMTLRVIRIKPSFWPIRLWQKDKNIKVELEIQYSGGKKFRRWFWAGDVWKLNIDKVNVEVDPDDLIKEAVKYL